MVKGFIFFRDGKIPFVIENYRMELFTDDSLLDDFCKEYNFKENYILHGQCFDIGIRGRKVTFLVENSIGRTCFLRCYIINIFDKDEEYDSIGIQSQSLDEVFRYEYEYIDMVRAGINLAVEPKVVYKVPFDMNDQKYELEFRIGYDNRLGLLEDLDRKGELILPLHTNAIQECYDITNVLHMSGKTSSGYNSELSEDNGVFIARCLSSNKAIFSHGHSWTGRRLLSTKTMLPVNAEGEPDYKYMAEYTQQKRKALQEKYRTYAEECIAKLGKHIKIPSISQKNWEAFLISDIFNILPGKRLVASDSTPGDRPFIGALDNSNGIARFVSDKNASLDSNVLGVNYNGNGMVIGFYHPYECIFSDDVKRFHLKHHEDNAFVLLFMKVAILQQKSKFGYLYKFNSERMANTRIMLPVTDDGTPDYEYMEQYAKNLMLRKYKQYLTYLDSKEKTAPATAND